MNTRYQAYATAGLASEALPIIPPNAPIHPNSSEGVAAGRGKIPGYKKAYVTLAAGEKIEFFEGV